MAVSTPTPIPAPAGCDTSRPSVVQDASGAVIARTGSYAPCLTYTDRSGGEATLTATSDGTVLVGGVLEDSASYPPNDTGAWRTTDSGGSWHPTYVKDSQHLGYPGHTPGDPKIWRDPYTNRVFFATGSPCTDDLAYSDDNGASWIPVPDPSSGIGGTSTSRVPFLTSDGHQVWASTACGAWDFETVFAGPPALADSRAALARNGYPNIVYWCASSHDDPDRQCYKSLDGGRTFPAELGGSPSKDVAGADGATAVGPDGTLFGLSGSDLYVSPDEGTTWTAEPLPSGLSATILIGANPGQDPAIDDRGDVYVVGTVNNVPALAYTTDKGKSWSKILTVAMPGVQYVDKVAVAADWSRPGHVAVAYDGDTANSSASTQPNGTVLYELSLPQPMEGPARHAYLSVSTNLLTSSPTFQSVQLDSDANPILPNGFPATPGVDYIGAIYSPAGRPWAYYPKSVCSAPSCASTTPTPNANPDDVYSPYVGAVGTVAYLRTAR